MLNERDRLVIDILNNIDILKRMYKDMDRVDISDSWTKKDTEDFMNIVDFEEDTKLLDDSIGMKPIEDTRNLPVGGGGGSNTVVYDRYTNATLVSGVSKEELDDMIKKYKGWSW